VTNYRDQKQQAFSSTSRDKDDAGGIAVPPHWTLAQIDGHLAALLMRHGPNYFAGKYRTLAAE